MEFARAQRTAANHDGSIAHLNARPRPPQRASAHHSRVVLTYWKGRSDQVAFGPTDEPKTVRHPAKTHGPGKERTADARTHRYRQSPRRCSRILVRRIYRLCHHVRIPPGNTPRDHSQSHSVAVVARLTVKRRSDLALRRVPKRRARNAPPNHRPPQSTSRKKTWSTLRKTTWSTSRKKSSIRP